MTSRPKPSIVVLGAGGHAKVVIDIIRARDEYELCGCLDAAKGGQTINGVKVLGGDDLLSSLHADGTRAAALGLGGNVGRARLGQLALDSGLDLPPLVSPAAYAAPSSVIGAGTVVMPRAAIQSDAKIGRFAIVNTGAVVEHDCNIGDGVHLAPGCVLCGNVNVGALSLVCAGTVIAPNLDIIAGTTVGAGSTVIRSISKAALYYGVPAHEARAFDGEY